VDSHGFLVNPPARSEVPVGAGPKTYQPVQNTTWEHCNSSAQPVLAKGSRGYQTYTAGLNMTVTWNITVEHLTPPDDLITHGVSFYWRDNTNESDNFLFHNILGDNTLTSGNRGFHSAGVPMPNKILTDATLLWVWLSQDGGYYFGCGDFNTVAQVPLAPTPVSTSSQPSWVPVVIGIAVGVALIFGIGAFCLWRKNQMKRIEPTGGIGGHYVPPKSNNRQMN